MSRAHVQGNLDITQPTVLTIMEDEARTATRDATKALGAVVEDEAPVNTGLLSESHKQSVTRTAYGVEGRLRRAPEAFYGKFVERGRKPGRSKKTGRKVSMAPADPFIDRAASQVEVQNLERMESGAARAAARIQARIGGL